MPPRNRRSSIVLAAASLAAAVGLAFTARPARSASSTQVTKVLGPVAISQGQSLELDLGLDRPSPAPVPAVLKIRDGSQGTVLATKPLDLQFESDTHTEVSIHLNGDILIDGVKVSVGIRVPFRLEVTTSLRKKGPKARGAIHVFNPNSGTVCLEPVSIEYPN